MPTISFQVLHLTLCSMSHPANVAKQPRMPFKQHATQPTLAWQLTLHTTLACSEPGALPAAPPPDLMTPSHVLPWPNR